MIERICQFAERSAISASRRQFLGQAAAFAAGLAVVFAGWLVPRNAQASGGKTTCLYFCSDGSSLTKQVPCNKSCPSSIGGNKRVACALVSADSAGC